MGDWLSWESVWLAAKRLAVRALVGFPGTLLCAAGSCDIRAHGGEWRTSLRCRHMLALPLWIVTEHIQPTDPEHTSEHERGTASAFSSVGNFVEFKKANRGGEWKMEAADDREGLVIVIADLHRLNIGVLILDPANDGTGGDQLTLADLVAFADSLKAE